MCVRGGGCKGFARHSTRGEGGRCVMGAADLQDSVPLRSERAVTVAREGAEQHPAELQSLERDILCRAACGYLRELHGERHARGGKGWLLGCSILLWIALMNTCICPYLVAWQEPEVRVKHLLQRRTLGAGICGGAKGSGHQGP